MTPKDLQKLLEIKLNQEQQQQSSPSNSSAAAFANLLDAVRGKPFWIWDDKQHMMH